MTKGCDYRLATLIKLLGAYAIVVIIFLGIFNFYMDRQEKGRVGNREPKN